jgi:hypothetical protein
LSLALEPPTGLVRRASGIFEHLLFEKLKLCYDVRIGGHKAASIQGGWRGNKRRKRLFYLNPL